MDGDDDEIFQHIDKALEAEDTDEKNYHIRQALQLIRIQEREE